MGLLQRPRMMPGPQKVQFGEITGCPQVVGLFLALLTPHKWVSFHYALIHSLLSHLCIKLMVHRYLPCATTTLLHIVGSRKRGISCITQVYTSWTPLHSTLLKFTWQEGVLFLPSLSENKWSTVCGTVAAPPSCRRPRRAPWSQGVAASASETSAFA